MSNPIDSNAAKAERIAAALAGSSAFAHGITSPNGSTAYGTDNASQGGTAAPESIGPTAPEQVPTADAGPAEPRHIVPNIGGMPETIRTPPKSPYEQLNDMLAPSYARNN